MQNDVQIMKNANVVSAQPISHLVITAQEVKTTVAPTLPSFRRYPLLLFNRRVTSNIPNLSRAFLGSTTVGREVSMHVLIATGKKIVHPLS